MTKTTLEVLKTARDLLVNKGWTQDVFARGSSGREVTTNRVAVCYCALGAVNVAAGGVPGEAHWGAASALEAAVDGRDVPEWNDTKGRTIEEVLAVFDKAIAAQPEPACPVE